MSCQECDTSLFFSLLLAGKGFAYDCPPPVVKFASAARPAPVVCQIEIASGEVR